MIAIVAIATLLYIALIVVGVFLLLDVIFRFLQRADKDKEQS